MLVRTSLALTVATDQEAMLRALLSGMRDATGAVSGGICLLEDAERPDGPCRLFRWQGEDRYDWVPCPDDVTWPSLENAEDASRLMTALRTGNRTIGALRIAAPRPGAFRNDHRLVLQILADHAAAAIEQSAARREAQARLRRLKVIEHISAAVNADGNLDDLLRRVLIATTDMVDIQQAQVSLVDLDRRYIRGRVGHNLAPEFVEATVRRVHPCPDPAEDMLSVVARTGDQVVTDNSHPGPQGSANLHQVFTPIAHGGVVHGVLSVSMPCPPLPEDCATLLLVAQQVSGAITRARLAEAEQGAREQAEQEHLRLKAVIEASYDAIFLKDLDGRYLLINPAGARRVQLLPEDIIGRTDAEIGPASFWEPALATDRQLLTGGGPVTTTHSIVVDGVSRVLVAKKTALRDAAGHIIGIVGVSRDITEQTQLAAERNAALAKKAQADGAMRTGHAIAHELAGPLTTILGLLTLLETTSGLPSAISDDLARIAVQAERAAELLRRFGRIVRYEEMSTPFGPQLNVRKATKGSRPVTS